MDVGKDATVAELPSRILKHSLNRSESSGFHEYLSRTDMDSYIVEIPSVVRCTKSILPSWGHILSCMCGLWWYNNLLSLLGNPAAYGLRWFHVLVQYNTLESLSQGLDKLEQMCYT